MVIKSQFLYSCQILKVTEFSLITKALTILWYSQHSLALLTESLPKTPEYGFDTNTLYDTNTEASEYFEYESEILTAPETESHHCTFHTDVMSSDAAKSILLDRKASVLLPDFPLPGP